MVEGQRDSRAPCSGSGLAACFWLVSAPAPSQAENGEHRLTGWNRMKDSYLQDSPWAKLENLTAALARDCLVDGDFGARRSERSDALNSHKIRHGRRWRWLALQIRNVKENVWILYTLIFHRLEVLSDVDFSSKSVTLFYGFAFP
jgi:hypothetical protein